MKKTILMPNFVKREGLVTVVTQEINTGEILMLAYTDEKGYLETLAIGEAVYFSTSRQKRWKKGEESGNVQKVRRVLVDCDGDAVIFQVNQEGQGACHTGRRSCFHRSVLLRQTFKDEEGNFKMRLVEVSSSIHS